LYIYIVILRLL